MNTSQDINYLKRDKINIAKWDATVCGSDQYRIYATSSWLDTMSPAWSGLVLNDYDAVMPLTGRSKFGIRYLAQPAFTQQCGVFSSAEVDEKTLDHFCKAAIKQFSFAEINVNFKPGILQSLPLKNYEIILGHDYNAIYKNYASVLKRNLDIAKKSGMYIIKDKNIDGVLSFYKKIYNDRFFLNDNSILSLKHFAQYIPAGHEVITLRAIENDNLLGCAFFIKDHKRIYNLASVTLPEGRKKQAGHFLYDALIREYAGSQLILDFEGSNIPGIAKFYQRFGAKPNDYYFIKWNMLPWPLRLLKK